jgi:membrane-associated phospholipid phosphatase
VPAVVVTTSAPEAQEQQPNPEPEAPTKERGFLARRAVWSILLLALVILERWLLSLHNFPLDPWAARIGMSHKPWPVWDITRLYQQVGRPLVAIGEVIVMVLWLWRRAGRRATQGLLVALMASATNGTIKILCGPTPLWKVLPHHVGTNFPSGVVTFMTASVGYIAIVAWRRGGRAVPIALALAIVGAGPFRVVGGQHLISDVVGAYMLGLAWLLLAHAYLVAPERRLVPRMRRRAPSARLAD